MPDRRLHPIIRDEVSCYTIVVHVRREVNVACGGRDGVTLDGGQGWMGLSRVPGTKGEQGLDLSRTWSR